MSLVSRISETMHNPAPVSIVDDILRPTEDNPLMDRGFVTTQLDRAMVALDEGSYGRCNRCGRDIAFETSWSIVATFSTVARGSS